MEEALTNEKPRFYETLSKEDQAEYDRIRAALSSKACRNNRNKRVATFAEMLQAIKQFCIRGDGDDAKRCQVCGVAWLPQAIAINTRQLRILIDKCKSSINGSLQRMGYSALALKNEYNQDLFKEIPSLESNFTEMREWSIRQQNVMTPQPELPVFEHKFSSISMPEIATPSPSFTYEPYQEFKVDENKEKKIESVDDDFYNDEFALAPSFFDESMNDTNDWDSFTF